MPLTRNRPCPAGRALGEQLDRSYNVELAKLGLADARCGTCAFRLGTVPNGCLPTVADAFECVVELASDFRCHERADQHGDALLCVGYMVLAGATIEAREGGEAVRLPYPYSGEVVGREGED